MTLSGDAKIYRRQIPYTFLTLSLSLRRTLAELPLPLSAILKLRKLHLIFNTYPRVHFGCLRLDAFEVIKISILSHWKNFFCSTDIANNYWFLRIEILISDSTRQQMLIETCLKVRNTLEMRSAWDLAFAIWRRPNRALFQSPLLANSLGRRRLLLFEIWKALSRDLMEEYVMVAPPDSLHLLLGLKAPMHQLLIDYLHLAKHTFTKIFLNVLHLEL